MSFDSRDGLARLPLFHALFNDDPESLEDPRVSPKARLKQVRDSVRNDLEMLLNTRKRLQEIPAGLRELQRSLFDYGIPNVIGTDLGIQKKRESFLQRLASTLMRHDPRLQNVKVLPLENVDPLDRTLRFRIEATLRLDSERETTVFDFQLEPVSRHFD